MYKAQKGLAEKAATSSLGKNILKEFLPDDTWFIMEALKTMITNTTSEKKAKEIEKNVIKLAVKVAYLYKGKHLTGDDMMAATRDPLLKMWQLFIEACDEKKRKLPEFTKSVREAHAALDTLFKPHIAPKSLAKMKDVADYLADEKTMQQLLTDPRHTELLEKVSESVTVSLLPQKGTHSTQYTVHNTHLKHTTHRYAHQYSFNAQTNKTNKQTKQVAGKLQILKSLFLWLGQ